MRRFVQSATRALVARTFSRSRRRSVHPTVAYRQRGEREAFREAFNAPEVWHEPTGRASSQFIVQPAGAGYVHPVSMDEVRERLAQLPAHFTRKLEVVQFSAMTRKRRAFPCYGMQWGQAIYLYPIEANLTEHYVRPPKPQQRIEAQMYGGEWISAGNEWRLRWTADAVRDFYLNNVLIHELGHLVDDRNTRSDDRERFANWFAIEYGYRASRGRAHFGVLR